MNGKKDWKGNSKTTFISIGASNHSKGEREQHDFYATNPKCAYDLVNVAKTLGMGIQDVWEPACGQGHLAKVFDGLGLLSKASDLIDRGYGQVEDFLTDGVFHNGTNHWHGDIITNPPYSLAEEFLLRAMDLLENERYYGAFLKLTWLEGKKRGLIFKIYPPKYVLVYSERQLCAKNGEFNNKNYQSKAIAYCWFIWQKGYTGDTKVKWI